MLTAIDRKKRELDTRCPLTEGDWNVWPRNSLLSILIIPMPLKEILWPCAGFGKKQVPLLEGIIKQIHYLVLADKREDRGVCRRVFVRIMGGKHEPVQPYLSRPKMEQLLEEYRNSTEHIMTRLAQFHIEFEGIPPLIVENVTLRHQKKVE